MTLRTDDWRHKLKALNGELEWLKELRFDSWTEATECAKDTCLDVFGLADGTFRLINEFDPIE